MKAAPKTHGEAVAGSGRAGSAELACSRHFEASGLHRPRQSIDRFGKAIIVSIVTDAGARRSRRVIDSGRAVAFARGWPPSLHDPGLAGGLMPKLQRERSSQPRAIPTPKAKATEATGRSRICDRR